MAMFPLKGVFANVDKGTDGDVYEVSVTDLASEVRMSGLGSEYWSYSDIDVDVLGKWATQNLEPQWKTQSDTIAPQNGAETRSRQVM